MIEILLIILLTLLIGGVAYWLWGKAPVIPEPFKAIGGWVILVVTVVIVIMQLVRLIHLIH